MEEEYHYSHAVLEDSDDDLDPEVKQYMLILERTQREIRDLENRLSGVDLTLTGYDTQQKLEGIQDEYHDLVGTMNQLHEALVTARLRKVEEIDGANQANDDNFLNYISEGKIQPELRWLEASSARFNQQLVGKRSSANARMVLTVSLIAVFIALVSILV